MKKAGRPGVKYEDFVEIWTQLNDEGRASTNTALELIGGSKSTIVGFREKYERESAAKQLEIIKKVKMTDAVQKAIAQIKIAEIEALEKTIQDQLKRIDEYIAAVKKAEETLAAKQQEFEEAKQTFESDNLKLQKQLAAVKAQNDDLEKREEKLAKKIEQLLEQSGNAKQEAAVAKKEVEMLRDQLKHKK